MKKHIEHKRTHWEWGKKAEKENKVRMRKKHTQLLRECWMHKKNKEKYYLIKNSSMERRI